MVGKHVMQGRALRPDRVMMGQHRLIDPTSSVQTMIEQNGSPAPSSGVSGDG